MAVATRTRKKAKPANPERLEAIRPGDGLIPLRVFLNRTGQKSHSWMTAKRKAEKLGITLAYQHGRRIFVSADNWIQFLMSNPAPVTEPRQDNEESAESSAVALAD